ncbi:MAG TPA: alpha-hydroxy-acid oxidizing protein, partial [Rhizomicrobium sp.]|nr:alpha-hydroxy-acid oxidizing protein [Rhizomicrobium sp.]
MSLAAPNVVNIKDLRRLARARLPDAVFDYLDGAADDEVTLKDSESAFQEVFFKPRFAVATPSCDLGVTVLGHRLDLPFILAPIGYSRLMHP